MEGKSVLFKKFADVDVFDIEVNANSIEEFIQTVVNISPTFVGINLEDIKAPDCFIIEKALKEKLDIEVNFLSNSAKAKLEKSGSNIKIINK